MPDKIDRKKEKAEFSKTIDELFKLDSEHPGFGGKPEDAEEDDKQTQAEKAGQASE